MCPAGHHGLRDLNLNQSFEENKQMKKLIVITCMLILALAAVGTPAFAAIEVEGDAYVGFYDKYLWRGFDLSGSKPVAQGGVDLTAGNFSLGYWTNVQLSSDADEGYKSGEATETDIVIDYSRDINDLVSISVGNIYYILDSLDDTNELYFTVALSTVLEPAVTVYYDWDEAQGDGLYFTASIGHAFNLSEALSLNLGALVGYNQESDYAVGDYTDWHNYELSVGVDYAVTDQISVAPSFLFSSGISDEAKQAIDSEMVAGVTMTLTF
jgi:uncharacterized protein (TIGR02001 family)